MQPFDDSDDLAFGGPATLADPDEPNPSSRQVRALRLYRPPPDPIRVKQVKAALTVVWPQYDDWLLEEVEDNPDLVRVVGLRHDDRDVPYDSVVVGEIRL